MARLPPIIEHWINEVQSKNTPSHIRTNYLMMLEEVSIACQEVLTKHRFNALNSLDKSSKKM